MHAPRACRGVCVVKLMGHPTSQRPECPESAAYGPGRRSPQRALIAQGAVAFDGAFTVDELLSCVRESDAKIGSATVYRAVSAMVGHGFLEAVGERDGHALYLSCTDNEHHHHLVCTGCGTVAHAPCPLDDHAIEQAAAHGFVITRHEVNIYGLCAQCLRRGDAR